MLVNNIAVAKLIREVLLELGNPYVDKTLDEPLGDTGHYNCSKMDDKGVVIPFMIRIAFTKELKKQ